MAASTPATTCKKRKMILSTPPHLDLSQLLDSTPTDVVNHPAPSKVRIVQEDGEIGNSLVHLQSDIIEIKEALKIGERKKKSISLMSWMRSRQSFRF